jgi:hypothetical protein
MLCCARTGHGGYSNNKGRDVDHGLWVETKKPWGPKRRSPRLYIFSIHTLSSGQTSPSCCSTTTSFCTGCRSASSSSSQYPQLTILPRSLSDFRIHVNPFFEKMFDKISLTCKIPFRILDQRKLPRELSRRSQGYDKVNA